MTKKICKLIVFGFSLFVLILPMHSRYATAQGEPDRPGPPEKVEFYRYQMPCPDTEVGGTCSPFDCDLWCQGKGDGFQCEMAFFEGAWVLKIACCACGPGPLFPGGKDAVTCTSNTECKASEECRETASPRKSKLSRVLIEPQPKTMHPKKKVCVPKDIKPYLKSCTTDKDCGPGALCTRDKKCMVH